MYAKPIELITPREAAALLTKPTRGKSGTVSTASIIRWGRQGRFPLLWENGWKVEKPAFLAWAARECRLPGSGRPSVALKARRKERTERSQMVALRLQQRLGLSY